MSSSTTPEWKLVAFRWLPLDRWTVDNLISPSKTILEKRYCKICDEWVEPKKLKKHVKFHVREEKDRRERLRLAAEAEREKQKEFERQERAALKPEKPQRISKPRKTKVGSEVVLALEEALTNLGEATVASLVEVTGLDLHVVRNQIKNTRAVAVGQVKTGGRGRPATLYGMKEEA